MKPRLVLAGLVVVLIVGATAVSSSAASTPRARRVVSTVDFSYPLDYYTDLCGFEVEFTLRGTIATNLVYDRAGTLIGEIDTQPGATQTFSSPETGGSFSFPFASILRADYTSGGAIGSTATVYGSGLNFHAPGISADSGRAVLSGEVVDITPEGIPIVAFTGVISEVGHANDPAVEDAAICAALAP